MDKDFDISAITETWLNARDYNDFVIGSLMAIAFYTQVVKGGEEESDCFSRVY